MKRITMSASEVEAFFWTRNITLAEWANMDDETRLRVSEAGRRVAKQFAVMVAMAIVDPMARLDLISEFDSSGKEMVVAERLMEEAEAAMKKGGPR